MLFYRLRIFGGEEDLYLTAGERFGADPEQSYSLVYLSNRLILKRRKKEGFFISLVDITEMKAEALLFADFEYASSHSLKKEAMEMLSLIWPDERDAELCEISVREFTEKISGAALEHDLITPYSSMEEEYNWEYFHNGQFTVKEKVEEDRKFSLEELRQQEEKILADVSLKEEVERIYDKRNPEEFLGHPVHYRISCGSGVEDDIVRVLVNALYSKGRLCSRRVNKITGITDCCYEEPELEYLIKNAAGSTVVIDMSGTDDGETRVASTYQQVTEFFDRLIRKYNANVLFIFWENTSCTGFSKSLLSLVTEYMNLVELRDGKGNREEAKLYFKELWYQSRLRDYEVPNLDGVMGEDKRYFATDIYNIFRRQSAEYLKKNVYPSYSSCRTERKIKKEDGDAYMQLSELIGLKEVKKTVNRIIATAIVDRRRTQISGKQPEQTRHMIFTGNPGSCKTTVARLLARCLREEGVLETGEFVECGRADLTGRYVGWTDKKVRAKFRRARGGVLFIDEAYSLVEEGGYYGDEAINTIVQEMENHREDVIVIFAGYTDRMKKFLDKNEGLRSRISFHIEFPDYSPEELFLILEKMLKDRNYSMTPAAVKQVKECFEKAVKIPEFGNGRFVRNLFEQAVMKQSLRLYEKYQGEYIPERELFILKKEDFALEDSLLKKTGEQPVGFIA